MFQFASSDVFEKYNALTRQILFSPLRQQVTSLGKQAENILETTLSSNNIGMDIFDSQRAGQGQYKINVYTIYLFVFTAQRIVSRNLPAGIGSGKVPKIMMYKNPVMLAAFKIGVCIYITKHNASLSTRSWWYFYRKITVLFGKT